MHSLFSWGIALGQGYNLFGQSVQVQLMTIFKNNEAFIRFARLHKLKMIKIEITLVRLICLKVFVKDLSKCLIFLLVFLT